MNREPKRAGSESAARLTLDHIGIAVKDLAEARAAFARLLGRTPSEVEEVPGEGVRVSFFDLGGARIELLEATRPDSTIARFLASGRSGVHHVALKLEGEPIGERWQSFEASGVKTVGTGPSAGSSGSRVFFVHPRSACGVLLEFTAADGDSTETTTETT